MKRQFMRVEIADHIALVTLDNPPGNVQSVEMMEEIASVFDEMNDRPEVRVVVLTGAGDTFSAGADLKRRAAASADPEPGYKWRRSRAAREKSYAVLECTKPVIVAVNGPCLGAGLGLAAMGDIFLASENAYFGLPEVNVGLVGGARHAMRLFPLSLVRRMALSAYRVSAQEAYRRGVIEAVMLREELLPYAMGIAREIASKSPVAVQTMKNSLFTIESMTIKDGYRYEQNNTARLADTEEAREALAAFLEKRPAIFPD